jgi:hypothetical protein
LLLMYCCRVVALPLPFLNGIAAVLNGIIAADANALLPLLNGIAAAAALPSRCCCAAAPKWHRCRRCAAAALLLRCCCAAAPKWHRCRSCAAVAPLLLNGIAAAAALPSRRCS